MKPLDMHSTAEVCELFGLKIKTPKYYNCIFDELRGEYNLKKPHQHKVRKVWRIMIDNDCIHNGIGFLGEDGKYRTGCNIKDFSSNKD